ncbi:MAG: hypothetical protein NC328_08140 [Muribaculum sp.]|nr:hypothetical protein [Muribaculum sp.]
MIKMHRHGKGNDPVNAAGRLARWFKWIVAAMMWVATGCETLTDTRIPSMPVYIEFQNAGMWQVYGVHGWGQSRDFIFYHGTREPEGFPYTDQNHTGYGGVMLIWGQNPFTLAVGPIAYDLSCPVEKKRTVRVAMTAISADGPPLAECPVCHSRYNVTERGGSPVAGPALRDHYQLKMYDCYQTELGGYVVIN